MDKTYDSIEEMLESNLKKIEKKGDISMEDLRPVKDALASIHYIEGIKAYKASYGAGMSNGYKLPHYNSYGPDRSPVTGRYISSNGNYGYPMTSGHSIQDRMVACIEPVYDEAKSEYERQMIRNTIAMIRNQN